MGEIEEAQHAGVEYPLNRTDIQSLLVNVADDNQSASLIITIYVETDTGGCVFVQTLAGVCLCIYFSDKPTGPNWNNFGLNNCLAASVRAQKLIDGVPDR